MKIKIKKLHPDAVIPKQMTAGAACVDVVATCINHNTAHAIAHTGIALEIPEGYKVVIVPRSSFCHKGWVMQNTPAQIDSDYRGEIILKFESTDGSDPFPYKAGDRVAQMYIERVIPFEFEEVDELSDTQRGLGGFGSTNDK